MSNFNEVLSGQALRMLLYGPPKSRKTWWAATAAEAGFNVILLNADNNIAVLRHLSEAARNRITIANIFDHKTKARCAVFLTDFLRGQKFVWDNTLRNMVRDEGQVKPDSSHLLVDASRLTKNDVVIMDSWTKEAHSLLVRYCNENDLRLEEAEEQNSKWDGFRWMKAIADWQLNQFMLLGCHVLVIGHRVIYEKRKNEKKGDKTISTVEWTREQPISTSGPAAMSIASHFTDVLYFEIAGEMTRIDSSPSKDRDGGSTIVPPNKYEFNPTKRTDKTLDFKKVCAFAGITPPNNVEEQVGLRYFKPGEKIPFEDIKPKALVMNQQKVKETEQKVIESKPVSLLRIGNKPSLQETAK